MDNAYRAILGRISAALGPWLPTETLGTIIAVALILVAGFAIVSFLYKGVKRLSRKSMPPRTAIILEQAVRYGGALLVLTAAFRRAGIDVSGLMGAAGIAGIAIGFAAQTSVSNIISGLFLFSERGFHLGDTVQVAEVTGVIEGIDPLSVRIRTFDNRLVRVPNETMIKTNIVNMTFWPTRRFDFWLILPHGTDFAAVKEILAGVVAGIPEALKDPEPFFMLDSAGPDGVSLLFGVWFKQEDMAALKTSLISKALDALAARGIEPQAKRFELSEAGLSSSSGPAKVVKSAKTVKSVKSAQRD